MAQQPGLIVLFGSGETQASGRWVFDWLLRRLSVPVRVAILETPAGFQPNTEQVAGQIGGFLQHRLSNYQPQITLVPARKRGTAHSPDNVQIAALIPGADLVFLGPGSPTYAVRQLEDSLTWHTLVACHRLGAAVVLASAATIAASAHTLPVYEIYKVGEDLHWHRGLDFFGPFGLPLVFVPHWNNNDGGTSLDTSRCYMGQARFESLLAMLPAGLTVVGIDEHTALALDLSAETCCVLGRGGIAVLRDGGEQRFEQGQSFSIYTLGPFRRPEAEAGIPPGVWEQVGAALDRIGAGSRPEPPVEVVQLLEEREALRARGDWPGADALRERIGGLGWQVLDTPDGPRLEPRTEGET